MTRSHYLSSVITAILFIAVLQVISAQAAARSVSPGDRLSIEQPKYLGEWKGKDITVEFSYSKNQGRMDLSGNVRFANYFMGYSRLRDFRLAAILLDENGRVIEEIGLVTNRGSFDPIPFSKNINLPPNAVSMVFTYQGTAIQSGMGGATSFSFYPVH